MEPAGASESSAEPPWDVIVVGAGAAGLACARAVSAAGLRTLVLEARDRCGGRAWSADALSCGVEVDLGGAWLHYSCPGNPMVRLARARGLELMDDPTGTTFVADVGGGRLLDKQALRPYYEAVEQALEKVEEQAEAERSLAASAPRPAAETLMQALLSHGLPLQGEGQADASRGRGVRRKGRGGRRKLDPQVLRWALAWELELDEGSSAEELSSVQEGTELPGDNALPPGGYGAFVRGLAAGPLDSGAPGGEALPQMALGVPAERIEWSEGAGTEPAVRVRAEGGAVHCARRAVVTLPLGVLKAGGVEFSPPLPQRKLDAIGRLGCAAMTKVFLRFPRRFWKDQVKGWGVVGLPAGQPEALFERAWFFPYPLGDAPEGTAVLCALLYGAAARELETFDDVAASAAALVALRAAAGCEGSGRLFSEPARGVPELLAAAVSRWHQDPRARCCWTALAPGSSVADVGALAEPLGLGRRLGFAGEHTATNDMGTVHGAWLTGLREAEAILLACLVDGRFAPGEGVARAAQWMLYCREGLAAARALHELNEECDSDSSSSS